MVASGNDFVVIEGGHQVILRQAQDSSAKDTERSRSARLPGHRALIRKICDRKYGIGADGLLILEKSRLADVRMRIFNSDGSEAEMCGNGARCVALFISAKRKAQRPALNDRSASRFLREVAKIDIETKAGIIKSEVRDNFVKIKLTDPKGIKLDIPVKINNRTIRVNFINTGVPHTVIFVEGLQTIDVKKLGSLIRYHRIFAPAGTNVNFVEVTDNQAIKIRTYERGVEAETLACGTGTVAAALVTSYKLQTNGEDKINVYTQGKEVLKVYFNKTGSKFFDVWLQGKAECVFNGKITF